MTLRKLLIANRGEIAARIARTARRMGLATVAVYSDADAGASHVRRADEAVRLGPAAARESYLSIERVLAAARASGADALHPGYGFLAESAELADACRDAGLVFVGPSPEAMRAMGDKARAKTHARAAGLPCVPGYDGAEQSDAALAREAEKLGYPLMIKAAAGGGGRGMRRVRAPDELTRALASARGEAKGAFGSDALILEKLVEGARHVEVQVLADAHGNVLHLGERDCSLQRRHQKIIEEAPSPAVSPELRQALGQAAVALARAVGYVGAGTVELLVDASGAFFFIEMNTRLQVEHPVTELVTGLDLVELQLRVAAGEALPLRQEDVRLDGHAIEARLYAEDPYAGFAPRSGRVLAWQAHAGARVDAGVGAGQSVGSDYDPMLAKIIAHGRSRDEARARLLASLRGTALLGVGTNAAFLGALLEHPRVAAGTMDTDLVDAELARGAFSAPSPTLTHWLLAAALYVRAEGGGRVGWSTSGALAWPLRLRADEASAAVEVRQLDGERYEVRGLEGAHEIAVEQHEGSSCELAIDGRRTRALYAWEGPRLWLHAAGLTFLFEETARAPRQAKEAAQEREIVAPMTGRVLEVCVGADEAVERGQRLVVLEAMKMEHEVRAAAGATVRRVAVRAGEQVNRGQLLVELHASS